MGRSHAAFLLAFALLAGCALSVPGAFSPVQGPLAQQSATASYHATLNGVLSGTVTVVLPNGEVCKGPWHFVGAASNTPVGADLITPPPSAIATGWDLVYGPGYYVAHVLGNKLYARATLTGTRGTTMDAEFTNENDERGHTKGIAIDNHGNLFKVSVYN
jgi:hypothetical protein